MQSVHQEQDGSIKLDSRPQTDPDRIQKMEYRSDSRIVQLSEDDLRNIQKVSGDYPYMKFPELGGTHQNTSHTTRSLYTGNISLLYISRKPSGKWKISTSS